MNDSSRCCINISAIVLEKGDPMATDRKPLEIILKQNYLVFQKQIYQLDKGVSMPRPC
jgi:hypothetical protein